MASLLVKDAYLQDLAKKICSQPGPERQRNKYGKGASGSGRLSWVPDPARG